MSPPKPHTDPSLTPRPDNKGRLITPCRPKWPGTMTDRERFVNQMHYRPVDRCFNMEFGYWAENFKVWPIFRDSGLKNNLQADIFFNFDIIKKVSGQVWIHPPFPKQIVSETEMHQIIINAVGLLAEVPKDGHDTIPHFIKSSINSPDDWKRIKAERFRLDDPARVVDLEVLQRAHPPGRDYPLGVDCGSMIGVVRDMLTFEGLAYACYDYPEMVEDMVETSCRLVEHFLDQVLGKIDFDYAAGWEDICFKNGPIVTVDFFRGVVVPRYKRISQRLRAHGIDLWYTDCDGDVRPLLPLLMEGGINCLFPFEVNSAGHPGELLNRYGRDLRIMGGVDKLQLRAGPAATRAYLETLVPLVERGGYIPFCDHRCPPDVKQEDYLYYLDLKEQMFGMKWREKRLVSCSEARLQTPQPWHPAPSVEPLDGLPRVYIPPDAFGATKKHRTQEISVWCEGKRRVVGWLLFGRKDASFYFRPPGKSTVVEIGSAVLQQGKLVIRERNPLSNVSAQQRTGLHLSLHAMGRIHVKSGTGEAIAVADIGQWLPVRRPFVFLFVFTGPVGGLPEGKQPDPALYVARPDLSLRLQVEISPNIYRDGMILMPYRDSTAYCGYSPHYTVRVDLAIIPACEPRLFFLAGPVSASDEASSTAGTS